jgi:CoA:oxalate CoA-transferase
MGGPLQGMRVLDLTWAVAGPYATLILRDLGAEVIKIEIPGAGDVTRYVPPYQGEVAAYFLNENRGKKAITLNLKAEEGRKIFLRLIELADVLVESFRPGSMDKLGLGYRDLAHQNPRLIYGAVSGFGQTGPYSDRPAYDLVAQAMGGTMSVTGEENGEPVKVGAFIGDLAASLYLVIGVLAALKERERSGMGQMVDVAMLDCQIALCRNPISEYLATGEVPRPLGSRALQVTPFQVFKTKDSCLAILTTNEKHWEQLCRVAKREDLLQDPRFMNMQARNQNYQAFLPVFSEIMASRNTAEWEGDLKGTDVICCPVYSIDQVVEDPQVKAREMIVEVPKEKTEGKGSFRVVGNPIKLSRSKEPMSGFLPELGENSEEILSELLGLTPSEMERMKGEGIL